MMELEHRAIMKCCADALSTTHAHHVAVDGLISPSLNNSDQRMGVILTEFWVRVLHRFGCFEPNVGFYKTFRESPLSAVFDKFQKELFEVGGREREARVLLAWIIESQGRLLRGYDDTLKTYRDQPNQSTKIAGDS